MSVFETHERSDESIDKKWRVLVYRYSNIGWPDTIAMTFTL